MSEFHTDFIRDTKAIAFDTEHRKKIAFNISRYDEAVVNGMKQYKDLELAKKRAAHLKHKALEEMEKYLTEFEANFEKRGGKVIWAVNEKDAVKEILSILKKKHAKSVVKSKSMTSEEIELDEVLEKSKIQPFETDLGEYIVQLADEYPYHIVTPAMHKSKEDVAKLFHEKFNTPADSTPEQITAFVRTLLREKFIHADAGITGANFLIADIGGVAVTENEGNALMSVSFPEVHIVVAGIEKIIPSVKDLHTFWPLLATHGTGQKITVYNTILTGPRQEHETDGPAEMYVILLDNHRTDILKLKDQRASLTCIRCGACLNGCPVYKTIGGHAYGVTYSGPIGSVISPHLLGLKDFKHLSFASSLCGKCTEVCPVKINLHEMLLFNRRDAVKKGYSSSAETMVVKTWKQAMMHRWMMNKGGAGFKNMMFRKFFARSWGPRRELPLLPQKNFQQLWLERKGLKK